MHAIVIWAVRAVYAMCAMNLCPEVQLFSIQIPQMDTDFHITFKVPSLPYEATSYLGKRPYP